MEELGIVPAAATAVKVKETGTDKNVQLMLNSSGDNAKDKSDLYKSLKRLHKKNI
jgi:hypothetical protein